MILDNLPTTEGQPVYALAEQVFTYEEPSIDTILGDDVKTAGNDGIFWASGAAIGTFTGEKTIVGNVVWYKINSTIYVKWVGFLQWRNKYASYRKNSNYYPKTVQSWFQGSQITTKDKATVTAEAKKAADDEFAKQLAAINGPEVGTGTGSPAPTATAGNAVFGTGTSSTNMILIIASVLTFGLLALIISKAKKKKQNQMNQSRPAVYQVPPGFVENLKTTKIR